MDIEIEKKCCEIKNRIFKLNDTLEPKKLL